jgi:hypothetical protein
MHEDYWGPVTWVAGDTWITRDDYLWYLDDDQPASDEDVQAVLSRTGHAVLSCDQVEPRPTTAIDADVGK